MEFKVEDVSGKRDQGRGMRHVRETLDVSPQYIADQLGVSVKQVYNLEKKREIQKSTLTKIAGILGVPFEYLENYNHQDTINNFYNHSNASSHDQSRLNENNGNEQEVNYDYDNDPNFLAMHERILNERQQKIEELLRENARLAIQLEAKQS